MNNFPIPMFTPIQTSRWITEENINLFERYLERWEAENYRDGRAASIYFYRQNFGNENRLTYREVKALVESGTLYPDFYSVSEGDEFIELNEHYLHSIVELYAHIQVALDRHRAQLDQIKGTPNGRIRPLEGVDK